MGTEAADLLMKSIGAKRRRAPRSVVLEPTLIARESTVG
jgi:DNA-binding LacI/PurR family transcriptional regulator